MDVSHFFIDRPRFAAVLSILVLPPAPHEGLGGAAFGMQPQGPRDD